MSGDMLRLLTDMRAEAEVLYLDSDPVMVALESTFARLEAVLRAQAGAEAIEERRKELLSTAVITFHRILKADGQGECCEIANWFLTTRAPALKAVGQPTYNRTQGGAQ